MSEATEKGFVSGRWNGETIHLLDLLADRLGLAYKERSSFDRIWPKHPSRDKVRDEIRQEFQLNPPRCVNPECNYELEVHLGKREKPHFKHKKGFEEDVCRQTAEETHYTQEAHTRWVAYFREKFRAAGITATETNLDTPGGPRKYIRPDLHLDPDGSQFGLEIQLSNLKPGQLVEKLKGYVLLRLPVIYFTPNTEVLRECEELNRIAKLHRLTAPIILVGSSPTLCKDSLKGHLDSIPISFTKGPEFTDGIFPEMLRMAQEDRAPILMQYVAMCVVDWLARSKGGIREPWGYPLVWNYIDLMNRVKQWQVAKQ